MTRITAYKPLNMLETGVWYGEVSSYGSNHITISAGNTSATYRGSFTFDYYGDVYGTLTGYEVRSNGSLQMVASDFSYSANLAMHLIDANDADELVRDIMSRPDRITGSSYADTLTGYSGSDTIAGGGGADRLIGGAGRDVLTGGGGADVFIFDSHTESRAGYSSRDVINDFKRGVDHIDLIDVDANTRAYGSQEFSFIGSRNFSGTAGELRFSNGVLTGDVNGDRTADFQVALTGITALSYSDLYI